MTTVTLNISVFSELLKRNTITTLYHLAVKLSLGFRARETEKDRLSEMSSTTSKQNKKILPTTPCHD